LPIVILNGVERLWRDLPFNNRARGAQPIPEV
ncbi:MAG: hypothetical protein ACI94D_001007, partial [Neolewinella sp.]